MAVTLHVALDPRDPAPADVAIVVDCIRATTTISHALAAGYASVTCVGEVADAHAERTKGVLLGGERHGVLIEGFDLGNSPAEYAERRGDRLVLTTTNGTRAILQSVDEATIVLVGALVNAQALVDAALAAAPSAGTIVVRCAGVRGEVALDDVYVAGVLMQRLAQSLPGSFATDGARTAIALARAYPDALTALNDSQSARDLDGTGHEADIARCAQVDLLASAPRVINVQPGRVVVAL
ncbi:MAG: 2-phosphosulfolactate phosphatase [Thermoleophilia bacterium]|nr:2-phosphosulfolactate phosphatase [Thermoleophilia bacterium]